MPDPATLDELNERFNRNYRVHGFGMDVGADLPCPFCAEADFMTYKLMEISEVLSKGAICKSCGRGARAEFHTSADGGTTSFELVQTVGDDAPAFLPPIRRVQAN